MMQDTSEALAINELDHTGNLPMALVVTDVASVENCRDPNRLGYRFIKRLSDITFSLAVLILLFVPCLILCLIIALESPGEPLYTQERVGRYGRPLRMIKFRTMYKDAHSHPERYLDEEQMWQWRAEFKVDNDPRTTQVGRLLRKTSLDELPQFINTLVGSMSVIGPRPITRAEIDLFGKSSDRLLKCKPGISGWWQVTNRNEASWSDGSRQRDELHYVDNAGLLMDTKIFFMTFRSILKRTGL